MINARDGRTMNVSAVGAIAIAIALGVAGCGDDESSTESSTAASITKEEFVTQANQICADGTVSVEAAAKKVFTSPQPSKAAVGGFVTETVIPETEAQVTDIRALGAPAGEEEQVDAILETADQELEALMADPSAIGPQSFAESSKLAADYGLNECADG